jgi:hypothetical protein
MAGNVRRISSITKRANTGAANNDGDDARDVRVTSDTASGLSVDDSFDPSEFDGAGNDADGRIEPEAPYGRKADGTPRKRRGRQVGTGTGTGEGKSRASKKKGALGVEGLSSILCNLTVMVAAATKVPEACLSNEETTLIADALENVAQYYDFSLNSKAVAWANLAMTVGGIAGSHIVAYKLRRDHEMRNAA